jgi:hypothetical protein
LYEGIMNKYADMYLDAWRCHGLIKNCKVPGVGDRVDTAYAKPVKVVGTVDTKATT